MEPLKMGKTFAWIVLSHKCALGTRAQNAKSIHNGVSSRVPTNRIAIHDGMERRDTRAGMLS